MISCIVPAFNEEKWLARTLKSLLESAKKCNEEVEIIVVDNCSMDKTSEVAGRFPVKTIFFPVSGRELAKNRGASVAQGDTLVFVDADLIVTDNFFSEIYEKSLNPYFVGGGMKRVKLTRWSLGIFVSMFFVAITLLLNQITVGVIWVRKSVFEAIGGFRIGKFFDDIDIAIRMKKYAKVENKKFESLKKSVLTWSTRRFDKYGNWYWFNFSRRSPFSRNPN